MIRIAVVPVLAGALGGCGALTQSGACIVAERHTMIDPNGPEAEFAKQHGVELTMKAPVGTNVTLCVW